jgi:Domain of unknown function (DUF4091)
MEGCAATHRHPLTNQVLVIALFLSAAAPRPAHAQAQPHSPSRLDVTRDAWVSEVGKEADGNNGGAPRLKLKSIQEMSLVDVDARPLEGRTIRSAALHLKKAGDERLERVTVSSVAAEWFEGTGSGYAIQTGGVTFRHRRHPDLPWSIGGGDLCHVILGNGGTIWRMADASSPDRDGWQQIPVDPRVVAARVAGISHGFLVFDDTGSEWSRTGDKFTLRLFPNRFVYSREQNRASTPYFTVELGPDDRWPPAAPSALRAENATSTLPAGEALISWVTPKDQGPAGTLGFFATLDGRPLPRELIPPAADAGKRVEMQLRDLKLAAGAALQLSVQAVDGAGNRGPAATTNLNVSSRIPAPLPRLTSTSTSRPTSATTTLPQVDGLEVAILDELDKIHPATGELIPPESRDYLTSNHLWSAVDRRVLLHAARNEFIAFQVVLRGRPSAGPIQCKLVFDGPQSTAIQVEIGRYYPVATKIGPIPDPIVPLDFPAETTLGTKIQSVHVELYVPHDLKAGAHHGTLTLSGPSARGALRLPVELQVWDFTLPDHLSFLPEMNCYGLPDNERDYYRLAHRHRTILNRVPYSQSGQVSDGCAPQWDSRRLDFDWSAWDRRFGPLLDGSAFADLPRKNVPVERFYLPLHENWPGPMEGNYNGNYWADQAFPASYRHAFVTAARQIATHFQARGWTETLFQGFLNNKNNFKARGWSRGSSPWLLDEPANFQDFWALRYFAQAFHEGINQATASTRQPSASSPKMVFRADISRPQWRRDSLDGLIDDHVVGNAMRTYPRLVFERKRTLGEIVLEYGSTNSIEGSNLQPAAWCLDVWSLGADGVIPWQTVGNAESWNKADELSLFYPARDPRHRSGPIPSIRLKSYRRGQQDVEYLTLWSQLKNEPRWAIGQQVRTRLKLAGTRQGTGFAGGEDAGRIDYGQLRPRDLWAMRVAIGEALSKAHPVPRSKLVDFRTPRRNPERIAPAYVGEGSHR